MIDNPFKEYSDTPVSVCRHLLDGAALFRVYHLPEEKCVWHLVCESNHQTSDRVQITLAKAYELFPEIGELAGVPKNMKVMLQKGKNSGKWYDFHIEG